MTAANRKSDPYPRFVLPGIETQTTVGGVPLEPGSFCTIDWLRGTCPDSRLYELQTLVEERFGPKLRAGPGAKYFKHGIDWPNGVKISFGHNSEVAMLDIRGECLKLLPYPERFELLRKMLVFGLKMTRVDFAIDYMFQNRNIYENALNSCHRRELARLRRFKPVEEFTADGTPKQRTLGLGSRLSSTYIRIYDKGLEQNFGAVGVWERIEVEFKDAQAPVSAKLVAESSKPEEMIPNLIFGCVDFRVRNGRSELERRPRAQWWADLVGAHGFRVRSACENVCLQRWRDAFVNSYGRRLLEMAEAVGHPVGELVEYLLEGARPSQSKSQLAEELRCALLEISGTGRIQQQCRKILVSESADQTAQV